MSESRAAIRYAKALLALANEQQQAEAIQKDMKFIVNTIAEHNELAMVLKNAVVKGEEKKEILHKVFTTIQPLSKSLFNLLTDNKRIDILETVAAKYSQLFDIQTGKETATVTTAVPMTNEMEIKVLAKVKELTSKSVELHNVIDETILGGFILRVGDKQYNASIASKLNKLKREFTLN
ncbi:MAG TPA: ATP synthase F1 subunit delta [Flavobacteriaceae bacterium]|nr:ATP synthase F1 subunit delta [Flavobacteriaceae bacterium]